MWLKINEKMKHTFIFKKAIIWAGMIFLATMILSPQKIYAACNAGLTQGHTASPPEESCSNFWWKEGSIGRAVYYCANYAKLGGAWGCYWHWYTCDTYCAGGGGGGASPSPPSCTPVCNAPYCGQGDGCGGTCSSSDAGVPGVPSLNPVNGGTVTVSEGQQATVSWSAPALADSYQLELYPAGTNCLTSGAYCSSLTGLTYSFLPLYPSYYYRVRALNSTCSTQ